MKYTSLLPSLICVLCLGNLSPLSGQSVIAADGGESGTEKIRIEWTLGEFAISSLATPNGWLTEGFHQPHLQVVSVPATPISPSHAAKPSLKISIAPNPVQDILNIRLQRKQDLSMQLRLLDANGRLLLQREILAPNQLELNLAKYPDGLYFLQFHQRDGTALKTFKVSKQ